MMSVQFTATCDLCGHTVTRHFSIYGDNAIQLLTEDGWDINVDDHDLCHQCSMNQWRTQQMSALMTQLDEETSA